MSYTHDTGTVITSYNSHKEHCFYEKTSKRQMFLIIEQFTKRTYGEDREWTDLAIQERNLLKLNGIK